MEPIQDIIATRPWANLIKGNLIRDEVLGVTTQEEIDEALKAGAIIKREGKSCVPIMQIIATKKGGSYSIGDMINVVSTRYTDFIANRAKRESARRYHDEAMMASLGGVSLPDNTLDLSDIPDFTQQEILNKRI